MTYVYSQEAKERIAAMGAAAITDFIEEIPHDIRKAVFDCLPKLPGGFRPGTTAEFKEKQRRIVSGLMHHSGRTAASDWMSFAMLWEGWGRTRLGDSFPDGDGTEPDADAGLAFIRKLVEGFPHVAREDAQRLLTFSGFPEHQDAERVLEHFALAIDVARNRLIDSLPGRLDGIEGRLGSVEGDARKVSKRMEIIEAATEKAASLLEDRSGRIDATSRAIDEMEAGAAAVAERLTRVESESGTLGATVRGIEAERAALTARVTTLEDGLGALAETREELLALRDRLGRLAERERDWVEAAPAIQDLSDRVMALESVLASGGASGTQGPRVRLVESLSDGPFIDISSVEDAVDVIAGNLQAAGVMKGAAQSVAREVAAALMAGQMVQFSGSLADFLADACAEAIGGPIHHEWRVPVGLVADEAAADCMDAVAEKGPEGCFVLKGANLSAFEVYGPAIRDIVVRRQFSAVPPLGGLALLATWAEGPAAFPDGGTLAELGPVFDTDKFAMRVTSAKLLPIRCGRLACGSWGSLNGEVPDQPPSTTLLLDILKEAGFDGGALWRRTAMRGLAALRAVPGGTEEGDVRSLVRSWVLPWAKACGGDTEELAQAADSALDDRPSDEAA